MTLNLINLNCGYTFNTWHCTGQGEILTSSKKDRYWKERHCPYGVKTNSRVVTTVTAKTKTTCKRLK